MYAILLFQFQFNRDYVNNNFNIILHEILLFP